MRKEGQSKTIPPDELLKIIETTNLVPFNAELKMPSFSSSDLHDNPQAFLLWFIKELGEFPLLVKHLLAETDELMSGYDKADKEKLHMATLLGQFREFIKNRNCLKMLVEIAEQYRKHLEMNAVRQTEDEAIIKSIVGSLRLASSEKETKKDEQFLSKIFSPSFRVSSRYGGVKWYMKLLAPNQKNLGEQFFASAIDYMEMTVNEQHQPVFEPGGLMRLIQRCDLRRFKQCVECQKIIWASRLDKKSCSLECSTSASQRTFQSDKKKRDEYNKKRRETYKNNKELKAGKERAKKNSIL